MSKTTEDTVLEKQDEVVTVAVAANLPTTTTVVLNDDKRADLHKIDPRNIKVNPNNKRTIDVKSDDMQILIRSIEAEGIITPLMLKLNPEYKEELGAVAGNEKYIAYAGNRRITAVHYLINEKGLDMKYVKAQIKKQVSLEEELLTQLVENNGVNFTVFEKAEVISNLIKVCGYTPKEVSEKTGEATSAISNMMQLAGLDKKHKKMIQGNVVAPQLVLQIIRESDSPEEFDAKMDDLLSLADDLKAQGKKTDGKQALITTKKAKDVLLIKKPLEIMKSVCLRLEKDMVNSDNVDLLFKLTALLSKVDKNTEKAVLEIFKPSTKK